MSDSTISQLPPALSLGATDLIPVDQGGVTKRATLAMLGNGTIFIAPGKSLTVNNTLTFAGTDGTTITFPATSATVARTDAGQTFTGTQVFGVITCTTINGGTLAFVAAKTLTVNNTITFTGTDGTTITLPATSATMARTDALQTFAGLQTFTDGITTPAQITSTIAIGTPPLVVASTTPVANLSIGGNAATSSSTTGNAATATALLNARTIDGVSFDGTANITVIAPATHAATNKTTPVAADEFPIYDSVSGLLNHLTYTNLVTTLNAFPNSGIFHVEAATGSNALTVTLKAGTILDFRSTTLTTGIPNTRTVPSDISMVVSSGSTLGTVSAVASEIIVVAMDNAGTVELAVKNISGGQSLDETGLISTTAEGGAGAADSATVFYSTTARTSLPYRVVGSVISTQTTAGTWAQTLTVQGAGGNALTAMSSLGYGQTWQAVTRTSGTTYYNITARPIMLAYASAYAAQVFVAVINGVTAIDVLGAATNGQVNATIIIPASAGYAITHTGTPRSMTELR